MRPMSCISASQDGVCHVTASESVITLVSHHEAVDELERDAYVDAVNVGIPARFRNQGSIDMISFGLGTN